MKGYYKKHYLCTDIPKHLKMRNIAIKINRLGPVADSEINLRPLMIFTGESGLGKSYISFLAHYVYALLGDGHRLKHFFDNIDYKKELKHLKSGDVILDLPITSFIEWANKDAVMYVRYLIGNESLVGDVEIQWPLPVENISFVYNEEVRGLENNEESIFFISTRNFRFNSLSSADKVDPIALEELLKAEIGRAVFEGYKAFPDTFLLPPARGSLMELSERPVFRSGMYDEFFDLKTKLVAPRKALGKEDAVLDRLIREVNRGTLEMNDTGWNYTTIEGVTMPLTAAASSIKELAPFTMLLSKYNLKGSSILLEEPEAHLHPARQHKLADLIGYVIALCGANIQITTHSDYLLKRLNLLIRLQQEENNISETEFLAFLKNNSIERESLLDPNSVGAYVLLSNNDGRSAVKELDTLEYSMIPYDSFLGVINADMKINTEIDKLIDGEN